MANYNYKKEEFQQKLDTIVGRIIEITQSTFSGNVSEYVKIVSHDDSGQVRYFSVTMTYIKKQIIDSNRPMYDFGDLVEFKGIIKEEISKKDPKFINLYIRSVKSFKILEKGEKIEIMTI